MRNVKKLTAMLLSCTTLIAAAPVMATTVEETPASIAAETRTGEQSNEEAALQEDTDAVEKTSGEKKESHEAAAFDEIITTGISTAVDNATEAKAINAETIKAETSEAKAIKAETAEAKAINAETGEAETTEAETINAETSEAEATEAEIIDTETTESADTVLADASGTCGTSLTWTYADGTLTISGTGKMKSYDYARVPWYDYQSEITSIIISDGVTSIGKDAFEYCENLSDVVIPNSVTSIGSGAFLECSSLSSIVIPDGVKSIGSAAFEACYSLSSIVISDSVKTIEQEAFYECTSLCSIVIPDSVTSIGDRAFGYCSKLSDVSLSNGLTAINPDTFTHCGSLSSIILPDGLTTIDSEAFANCSSLSSITIPDSLTTIGSWAFQNCSSLSSITLPDGLTTIDSWAFKNCSSLSSITLPDSLTEIDSGVFSGCSSLSSITIPENVMTIGDSAFKGCSSLSSIVVPDCVTSIGGSAFKDCSSLTTISIPDTATIGGCAFQGCSSLEAISIPDAVTNIRDYTFEGCSRLTTVSISANVTYVGSYAFSGCSNLTDVYIYSKDISFDKTSFYSGTGLITFHAYTNVKEVLDSFSTYKYRFVNLDGISILSQPSSATVTEGEIFTVEVAADSNLVTYLWQYSKDNGETWIDTSRTKNNYKATATKSMDGRMFRCVITDLDGKSVISDAATISVKAAIEITAQPVACTVNLGDKFTVKVSAKSNTGSKLTYLWQYSKTLKGWTDTTRTLNNYGTNATLGVDGKYFRCRITDEAGNVVYSEPAMIRVLSDITITSQPTDTTVATGKRYYFTVAATGANLTYKWEYSKDGGNTWIATTRTKNNYTTYAKKAMNGWTFRCVITDSSNNSVTSEAGTLTVN